MTKIVSPSRESPVAETTANIRIVDTHGQEDREVLSTRTSYMNTGQEAGTKCNPLGDILLLVPSIHNQLTINRISDNRHMISIIGTHKPIQLEISSCDRQQPVFGIVLLASNKENKIVKTDLGNVFKQISCK